MSEERPEQLSGRPGPEEGSWPPPQPASWPPPQPAPWPPPRPQWPSSAQAGGPPYSGQPYSGQPYPGQPYPTPGPAWPGYAGYPQPPAYPTFPHPEPREYHQMLRTWTYSWWKPTVGMLVCGLAMLLVMPIVLLPVLALGVWLEGGPFLDTFLRSATMQEIGPSALLYLNLVLGSMILVTWFVIRFLHRMRPRWLTSVVPRMRWRFLGICLGLSFVALIASVVVGMVVPGDDTSVLGPVNDFTRTTALITLVVVLTTPFQAAGEEYLFRGYLLQAVGSMIRRSDVAKWVAIGVTSLLFAIAHGGQNFPLFFDRFAFGLIAGWLVIRTGGLEAGIALHILNNFLAYGFALTFGDLTESLTVSEVSWWNVPVTLTQEGVYALLVVLVARRMGLQTRTRPPRDEVRAEPLAVPA
ncbi:MAG TPA: CPBP family glutamic-type intramembrane protease [Nocardioides sp.]|nr:CPBP family glutamic-type intramembrane protease [Nocardioides sp.]